MTKEEALKTYFGYDAFLTEQRRHAGLEPQPGLT